MRTSLAAAIAAVAVVASGPPAAADTWAHQDPVADASSVNEDNYIPEDPWSRDPHAEEGDIIGVRANHLPRKVLVTLTYRQLTAPDATGWVPYLNTVALRIKTGDAIRNVVVSLPAYGRPARITVTDRTRRPSACPGATESEFYDVPAVVIRIPRSCFARDWSWVRVAAGSFSTDNKYTWRDDANRQWWPSGLSVLGPRIYL